MSSSTLNDPALPWDGLHFIQGDSIASSATRHSNIVVLEQWATWCPPCRQSIPHLNALHQRHKKDGVVVIGISNETDESKLRKFVAGMGDKMQYRVAMDRDGVMDAWSEKYSVQGIPHAFVIDWEGRVRWSGHPMGGLDKQLEATVNEFKQWKQRTGKEQTQSRSAAGTGGGDISANQLKAMSEEELKTKSVSELMHIMRDAGLDTAGCIEKTDLINRIKGKQTL